MSAAVQRKPIATRACSRARVRPTATLDDICEALAKIANEIADTLSEPKREEMRDRLKEVDRLAIQDPAIDYGARWIGCLLRFTWQSGTGAADRAGRVYRLRDQLDNHHHH